MIRNSRRGKRNDSKHNEKISTIKPENIRIKLIATYASGGGFIVHRKEYEENLFPSVSESHNQAQLPEPKVPGGNRMPTINTNEVLLPIIGENSKKRKMKHRHLKFIGEEERKYNIGDPPNDVKKSSSLRRAYVKD
uniref:Uncharacterized protein n=1 Tax=Strongyloides papillosus TaxID=174720 RepID=A0A0N5BVF4_STREA